MSSNLNSTATFKANISQLKAQMQAATRAVKLASAEFKAATAGMDDWGSSADGLEAKLKQLDTTLTSQKTKLSLLEAELKETTAEYGENSAAADRVRTAIFNQQAAIAKTEQEIRTYSARLEEVNKAADKAADGTKKFDSASDKLNATMDEQERELEQLKAAYVNATLEGNTEDAEAYASAIEDLSGELADNKKKMSEAEKAADELDKSIEEAGDDANEASDGFTVLKGALANLAASAVKELGRKLVEAAKYALEVGKQFEVSMSQVKALSGATGEELDALRDKAQELGRTTQFSASEAADALSAMALAGWDTQEMLDGIDGVLQLAAAGGMDLGTAADTVAGYLAAFNLKAKDSTRLVDVMARAQSKSKTTTDQLAEAYSTSATNLTQAGQSMETTTALIEGLASVSDTGSSAGTKLSAAMAQITQKMDDGKIAIGDTTVAVTDSDGAFRDMIDIIADVEAATDGMTDAERASALQKTFNRQSMSAMNELLSVGSEKLRDYKTDLENSDGAAADMAKTMQDNLSGALAGASSATEGLGIALYNKVKGPVTGAVRTATKLINGITDAISPQKSEIEQFIKDIEASNKKVQGLLDAANQDVKNAESKVGELEAYKNTIIELQNVINSGGKLDDFELYQMKNAVDAVASAVPEIGENFDETTGKINLSTEAIEQMFKVAEQGAMQQAYQSAMQKDMEAYAEALVAQARATAAVKKAQKDYDDYVAAHPNELGYLENGSRAASTELIILESTLNTAKGALSQSTKQAAEARESYETLAEASSELAEQQTKYAASQDDSVRSTQSLMDEKLGNVQATEQETEATEQATTAVEEYSEAEEEAAKAAEEAAKKIEKAHDDAAEAVKSAYESAKTAAEQAFDVDPFESWTQDEDAGIGKLAEAFESQIEGLTKYADNLQTVSEHIGQEITPEFMMYLQDMGTEGAQVMQELANAFDKGDTDKVADIMQKYADAIDLRDQIAQKTAANEVAIQLGLNGMSSSAEEWEGLEGVVTEKLSGLGEKTSSELSTQFTEMAALAKEMGVAIPDGLAEGIESGEDPEAAIRNAIDQLEGATQGALEGLISVAEKSGVDVPKGLKDGIESGETDVLSAWQTLIDAMSSSDVTSSAQTAGEDTGKQLTESQASGQEAAADSVTDAAKTVAEGGAEAAEDAADEYKDAGETAGEEFAEGVENKESEAKSAGETIGKAVVSGIETQTKSTTKAGEKIGKAFATAVDKKKNEAKKSGTTLGTQAATGAGSKTGEMSKSGTSMGAVYASAVSAKAGAASAAGRTLGSSAAAGAGSVSGSGAGAGFGSSYASGVRGQAGSASAAGSSLGSSAQSGAKSGGGGSRGVGVNFGQGYIQGIRSQIQAAYAAGFAMGQAAVQGQKAGQASKSPSKLTFKNGVWFTQGYILGIMSEQANLQKAVQNIVGTAVKTLKNVKNYQFGDTGTTAADLFANAFAKRSSYMVSKIQYQNDQAIESIETKIAELTKNQKTASSALQATSDAKITKLKADRDTKSKQYEAQRDKTVKQIEVKRDTDVAKLEAQRDVQVKKLEAQKAAAKNSTERNKISTQIANTKNDAKKLIDQVKKSASDQIDATKTTTKNQIEKLKENTEKAIEAEKKAVKKRISASDANYTKLINSQKKYLENYQNASSVMLEELSNAMNSYQEQANVLITDTISGITDKYDESYAELVNKQDSLVERMRGIGDLFDISDAGIMTVNDLTAQTKQIRDYAEKLTRIRDMVSSDLFERIAEYDMKEGNAFMDRLLAMSREDLEAYDDAYAEKLRVSSKAASDLYAKDFGNLTTAYKREIDEAYKELQGQLEGIAKDIMQGFADGLLKNSNYMKDGVRKIVNEMLATVKKQLGIKSPSRVMFEIGEYAGEGLANGIKSTVKQVKDAAMSLVDAAAQPLDSVTDNITDISGAVRQNAASGVYGAAGTQTVTNNYNLVQNNNSPKPLSALDTYRARRQQIALVKAFA